MTLGNSLKNNNIKIFLGISLTVGAEALFQRLFLLIEQALIGRISLEYVGVAGVINNLFYMVLAVIVPVGGASAIIIAQLKGRNDEIMVSRVGCLSLLLAGAASIAISSLFFIFREPILWVYGLSTIAGADSFFILMTTSAPIMVLGSVGAVLLRVTAHARSPFLAALVSLPVANVITFVAVSGVIDWPPSERIMLVGWAILIGYTVRLAIIAVSLRRTIITYWGLETLSHELITKVLRISLPMSASKIIWTLSLGISMAILAGEGPDLLAISQIVITFQVAFIMLGSGIPVSANSVVGSALGSGNAPEIWGASKMVISVSAVFSLCLALMMWACALVIPFIYEIPKASVGSFHLCMFISAFTIPLIIMNMSIGSGIVASGGKTGYLLYSDFLSSIVVGLPISYLFAISLEGGIPGVFIGRFAEELVRLVIVTGRYRSGRWVRSLATG